MVRNSGCGKVFSPGLILLLMAFWLLLIFFFFNMLLWYKLFLGLFARRSIYIYAFVFVFTGKKIKNKTSLRCFIELGTLIFFYYFGFSFFNVMIYERTGINSVEVTVFFNFFLLLKVLTNKQLGYFRFISSNTL